MSGAAASAAQRAGLRIKFDDLYRKLLEDPTLQLDQAVVARMSTAMQSYQAGQLQKGELFKLFKEVFGRARIKEGLKSLMEATAMEDVAEEAAAEEAAAPRPPPSRLVLSGSLEHQSFCLGAYSLVEGRKVHGRPVWKHATKDRWIAASSFGNWLVQASENLGAANSLSFLVLRDSSGMLPHESSVVWQETRGRDDPWVDAPSLKCAPPLPPPSLVLSGSLEHQRFCLGAYSLVEGREVHGRPVWKHATEDRWIAADADGDWLVQESEDGGANEGSFLRLHDTSSVLPHESSVVWQEGTGADWVDAPSLKCVDQVAAERAAAERAAAERAEAERAEAERAAAAAAEAAAEAAEAAAMLDHISVGHKNTGQRGRRPACKLFLSEMTKGIAIAGEQGSGKTVGTKTIVEHLLSPTCPVKLVVTFDIAGELGQIGAPQDEPSDVSREFEARVYTNHCTFSAGAGQNSSLNPFSMAAQLKALPYDTAAEQQIFAREASPFVELLLAPVIRAAPTGGRTLFNLNFPSVSSTAFGTVTADTKQTVANALFQAVKGVLIKCKAASGGVPRSLDDLCAELRCATEPQLSSGAGARGFKLHPTIKLGDIEHLAELLEYYMQPGGEFGVLYVPATATVENDNPDADSVYPLTAKELLRDPVHEKKKHSIISLANLDEQQKTLAVRQILHSLERELPTAAGRLGSKQNAPKIAIVIDEVGALCPYDPRNAANEGKHGASAYIAQFLNLCRKYGIIVLLSTQCVGQLHPVVRTAIGGPVFLGYPGGREKWKNFVDTRYGADKKGDKSCKKEIISGVVGLEKGKHEFVLLPPDKTKPHEVATFDLPIHKHQDAGVFGRDVTAANRDKHPIVRTDETRRAKRARVA